jgi:hypothetical protein
VLADEFSKLRAEAIARGESPVPDALQGVTKAKVRAVLARIARDSRDQIDTVFALLDDVHPSCFPKAPAGARFCDGATTAHLGCHVGIWQRGEGKADREGRDYWIKPLREVGAIEPITLVGGPPRFIAGHVKAKSPNSAYRLNAEFVAVLKAPNGEWERALDAWISESAVRRRLELQARLADAARREVDDEHGDLIEAAREHYVPLFLPGFVVVYSDSGDGDRITTADREALRRAGIEWDLGDAMPDLLLWNKGSDWLWVIEAVTSDGEVDQHKVDQIACAVARNKKPGVGFTTVYATWRAAAARQSAHKNLAAESYLWIREDPGKQFKVTVEPTPD